MKLDRIHSKIGIGIVLGLSVATLASAATRQSQERQQRQQRQRTHQKQEQRIGSMAQHTKENIVRAMKREALATIKYRVFSEVAKENGNNALSELFLKIAQVESDEHLKELFILAKVVGSDIENLKHVIGNETYDSSLMYKTYAAKAKTLGDLEAAKLFEEMAKDEAQHREVFIQMLKDLQE